MKKLIMISVVLLLAALLVGCVSSVRQAAEPEEPTIEETYNKATGNESADGTETESIGFVFSDAAILQTETIGGLKLGMTEEEFTAIMGQPDITGNVSMETPDGAVHFSWFYDTGAEPNNDTQLSLADIGEGWFLNEIYLSADSTLTLSTGIGIGSTDEEIAAAYPQSERRKEELIKNDQRIGRCVYTVDDGLQITTENGVCSSITLGRWLQIPPEEAWETEPLPYDLHSNEITIYQWIDEQWHTTKVIDRAAKWICTILTISEPETPTGEKTGVSAWRDFGNGTAVELQGNDRAAVWTYEDDFDPDRTDGLTYQLGGVFLDLDDYVEKALADPDAGWED